MKQSSLGEWELRRSAAELTDCEWKLRKLDETLATNPTTMLRRWLGRVWTEVLNSSEILKQLEDERRLEIRGFSSGKFLIID